MQSSSVKEILHGLQVPLCLKELYIPDVPYGQQKSETSLTF